MKKKLFKAQLPKNVIVLTNIWTANQNADAPTSTGIKSIAAGATGTLDAEAGVITATGLTAAAGVSEKITVNNKTVKTDSRILITAGPYTGTFGANGIPVVTGYTIVSAGQFEIQITNLHGANALDGDLNLSFQVGQVVV
jgi:hypothetical protein